MDFFEKLDELHAKEVSPKEFKEINGVSQKKVMKNVMDFVDKFDARAARAAAKPADALVAKIRKALAAAGIEVPKAGKADEGVRILGRPRTSTLGDIIEVKLEEKNGVLVVTTGKGAEGLPGRVAAGKTGIEKFVESVKGVKGIGIKGIKFVEGHELIKKGKGGGLIPKVAKGPKGPKGGGPKM